VKACRIPHSSKETEGSYSLPGSTRHKKLEIFQLMVVFDQVKAYPVLQHHYVDFLRPAHSLLIPQPLRITTAKTSSRTQKNKISPKRIIKNEQVSISDVGQGGRRNRFISPSQRQHQSNIQISLIGRKLTKAYNVIRFDQGL
jgi:hypothetical protein